MKKALVLAVAVLVGILFSFSVAATGPLLGFGFVPQEDADLSLMVGFNFASVNLEIQKDDLTDLDGDWSFGVIWVPQQGNFGYRAGMRLVMDYDENDGLLEYEGFEFVVGVSNTWGPIQLYVDANIAPTGELGIVPTVGINILFGDLIPGETI